MVISRERLEKIREIIEKNYSKLVISTLGRGVFSQKELRQLKEEGVDVSNDTSLLSLIYNHNFINSPIDSRSPTSVEEMKGQQSQPGITPSGEAHDYTLENLNDKTRQLIDKLRGDVQTRLEGIIRDNNDSYKLEALQNLDRSEIADQLVKESTLGRVKQRLRDTTKDGTRDWMRVALTEMSNAIGTGSVDRIVSDNRDNDLEDVYVYRVIVGDDLTCKWCRKFYGDVGEAPKVYKLSTLLANGSNYGKKSDTWGPVIGATHPNTRTSQIIELRPGFAVQAGGSVTYIGMDKWPEYIHEVLVA